MSTQPVGVGTVIDAQSPWPGLNAFDETTQHFFNGRDAESAELLRLVGQAPLTVLFGKSGLGKTSLVQAGLFPRLRQQNILPVYVRLNVRDRSAPIIQQAAAALQTEIGKHSVDAAAPNTGESLWEYLHGRYAQWWSPKNQPLTPLFVFDQFEEAFTLGAENADAIERLRLDLADLIENRIPPNLAQRIEGGALAEQLELRGQRYKVLLSFREDFLPHLEGWRRTIPSLGRNRMRLLPMNRHQAYAAVHDTAPHLTSPALAWQIVDFLSAASLQRALGEASASVPETLGMWEEDAASASDKAGGTIEPALLSLFCSGLYARHKQRSGDNEALPPFDASLLEGAKEAIIADYYRDCLQGLPANVPRFIEEELITDRGYLNSYAVEDAIRRGFITNKQLDHLINCRLLRLEERHDITRVELTHDVLTQAVREERDRRRVEEGRRDLEERNRKQRRLIVFAVIIIMLLGGACLWLWDTRLREHVEHYNDFTKRWGKPVGIGRLTPEKVGQRAVSLKFIRYGRRHPVERVVAVNSQGECTPRHNIETYLQASHDQIAPLRECQWEFVYDAQERVVYEKASNKLGQMVWGFIYSPSMEDGRKRAHYVGPDGFPRPQLNSSAEFVEFTYSSQGDEIRTIYFDRRHQPQPGPNKAFGQERAFYLNGWLLTSLDPAGRPMVDTTGSASQKLTYDDLGNVVEAVMLDANGKAVLHKEGWHRFTGKYDARGNQIEWAYFDTAGQATLHKEGYHRSTAQYDARGNQIEWAYFDTAGQATLHKEGYHRSTAQYDARGNQIEGAYFDTAGQTTLHKEGYHRSTAQYDERGNQIEIEWAYFDTTGQATLHKEGYHRSTIKYNEHGNAIEWAYFDTAGQATLHKEGYHRSTAQYDARGNQIEWAAFDTAGQATLHKEGYHRSTIKYNEYGNAIEWAAFDTAGQATLHKEGYHRSTIKYNEHGNAIEWAYFDTAGQATLHKEGWHRFTGKYDAHGNQIEWAYFDTTGQATLHKEGYHRSTAQYDARGNQIEWAAFDTAGQATLHKEGYHRSTAQYDARGNQIEWAAFDTAGQATLHKEGWHRFTGKYDARGNQIEWAAFDTTGQATLHKDGYHRSTIKYDERGNAIEWAYFDTAGQATLHKEGYHRSTAQYDARGNQIEWAAFDTAGQATLHKEGWHRFTGKYDARGNQIEWAYFDTAGQATLHKEGYHRSTIKYDEHGNQIEWAAFDTAGQATLHKEGYHRSTIKYNEYGNAIEWAAFDTAGQATLHKEGYHRSTAQYDTRGNAIQWATYGITGELLSSSENSP